MVKIGKNAVKTTTDVELQVRTMSTEAACGEWLGGVSFTGNVHCCVAGGGPVRTHTIPVQIPVVRCAGLGSEVLEDVVFIAGDQ